MYILLFLLLFPLLVLLRHSNHLREEAQSCHLERHPASPALAASSVAEISREPSEIVESYNEPAAADAAVDGLADDDESEHMPLEAHT